MLSKIITTIAILGSTLGFNCQKQTSECTQHHEHDTHDYSTSYKTSENTTDIETNIEFSENNGFFLHGSTKEIEWRVTHFF